MSQFHVLPLAEKLNTTNVDISDDDTSDHRIPNCPVRKFANKYISFILLISCIIGFIGIFINHYYLLGITFGVPVITLGAAVSPQSSHNSQKLSESGVLLKILLGEIGLFLMATCFSLLSSKSGWRPLPQYAFIPALVLLVSSILFYFLSAPVVRMVAIYKRKNRCIKKVTMYFSGYTRASSAANNTEQFTSDIYPQFVYSYKGEKYRVTDWEDKIRENGKVSSLDILINPDAPDEYYDSERLQKRIIDSIITLAATLIIILLMMISILFVLHADLSAEKYSIMEGNFQNETETTEELTTEEVEDY